MRLRASIMLGVTAVIIAALSLTACESATEPTRLSQVECALTPAAPDRLTDPHRMLDSVALHARDTGALLGYLIFSFHPLGSPESRCEFLSDSAAIHPA